MGSQRADEAKDPLTMRDLESSQDVVVLDEDPWIAAAMLVLAKPKVGRRG